jgi:hypothetical protein
LVPIETVIVPINDETGWHVDYGDIRNVSYNGMINMQAEEIDE